MIKEILLTLCMFEIKSFDGATIRPLYIQLSDSTEEAPLLPTKFHYHEILTLFKATAPLNPQFHELFDLLKEKRRPSKSLLERARALLQEPASAQQAELLNRIVSYCEKKLETQKEYAQKKRQHAVSLNDLKTQILESAHNKPEVQKKITAIEKTASTLTFLDQQKEMRPTRRAQYAHQYRERKQWKIAALQALLIEVPAMNFNQPQDEEPAPQTPTIKTNFPRDPLANSLDGTEQDVLPALALNTYTKTVIFGLLAEAAPLNPQFQELFDLFKEQARPSKSLLERARALLQGPASAQQAELLNTIVRYCEQKLDAQKEYAHKTRQHAVSLNDLKKQILESAHNPEEVQNKIDAIEKTASTLTFSDRKEEKRPTPGAKYAHRCRERKQWKIAAFLELLRNVRNMDDSQELQDFELRKAPKLPAKRAAAYQERAAKRIEAHSVKPNFPCDPLGSALWPVNPLPDGLLLGPLLMVENSTNCPFPQSYEFYPC